MNTDINLKNLWHQQQVCPPDKEELYKKLTLYKKQRAQKTLLSNLLLLATAVFVAWIWFYYKPIYISTKTGILLTLIAIISYVFVSHQLFLLFRKIDETLSPKDFLKQLKRIKSKQNRLQTTVLSLYFILLSLGIALYMYEYVQKLPTFSFVLAYGITFLWFAYCWFIIRPKKNKKYRAQLNDYIEKVGVLQQQFSEEDEV